MQLATQDPLAAIQTAEEQTNVKTRHRLLLAVVEGWAAIDPDAATDWIQGLLPRQREEAFARIVRGQASVDPKGVLRAARESLARGGVPRERGFAIVDALAHHGAYGDAVAFAQSLGADGSAGSAWLAAAYQRWAEYRPEDAAVHALQQEDPVQASSAFNAVVMGWAQTEPASLADFASGLPAGPERTYAMGEALRQWVDQEPLEAANWIDRSNAGPDLDEGVLALVNNPYLGEGRPAVAASWAESLHDDHLRSETLSRIVRQWAASDRKSARRYVENSGAFLPRTREELLALLEPP